MSFQYDTWVLHSLDGKAVFNRGSVTPSVQAAPTLVLGREIVSLFPNLCSALATTTA